MSKPEPLRYAADVTLDDLDAVNAFLRDRLINKRPSWAVGTEEFRNNSALRGAWASLSGMLGHALGESALAHASQDKQWELDRRHTLRSTWNELVDIAQEWDDTDGFDAARWVRVRFHDTADEEKFRVWEAKEKASAEESAEFISEYRIPGPRSSNEVTGEFVVARDPDHPSQWAVFEGNVQGRHWDGSGWQHARFTGASPYRFSRESALATARQQAAEGTQ
ncbi:hypothetical protein OG373_13775 [Streptomyces avidinii]|uniref:hypothetical protein n=1 Tax=Streptomyces avidinii TaxID=1895 RepID=UPI00386D89C9|nr:hypothetical protein OG373_13775 [Streptomyces avidinii]